VSLPVSQTVTACGGVLYRITGGLAEILLIYRKGYWDLPKGHLDSGETLEGCAAREVTEEIGISTPMIVKGLLSTQHSYELDGQMISKITWWYAMVTDAVRFSPQQDEGIEKVCWFPVDKACKLVGYDNLRLVLKSLLESSILPDNMGNTTV
jgi:8-oxo-dGTP pyrophosphatase MutT (NUDIX family)